MKHGGDLTEAMARHGAGDPPWLDLSTGINPHPWPVPPALSRQGWERLPSRADEERLIRAARAAYGVPDEAGIVAAPGTQALIQWLPRLAPPGGVAVLGPTYAEHAASWRLAGAETWETAEFSQLEHIWVDRGASFEAPLRGAPQDEEGSGIHPIPHAGDLCTTPRSPSPEGRASRSVASNRGGDTGPGVPTPVGFADSALPSGEGKEPCKGPDAEVRADGEPRSTQAPRHLVVVHPNNPDGRLLSEAELLAAARLCRERGGWLIVDESFADVAPERSAVGLVTEYPVIVLRSFGKFYGLAGLRLGFAVAAAPVAEAIRAALGPWAVSGPAIAIGTAALADRGWADRMRARLAGEAGATDRVLAAGGFEVIGGTSLYRLARHARAPALHEALAAEHIWVRRFAWAPDLLRFGLPPDEAGLDRLGAALRRAGASPHDQGTTTIRP